MDDAALSSPLMEAFPIGRLSSPDDSPAPSPTRTEIDLPPEVDESFNSSMSFSVCDSPPQPSPSMHLGKAKIDALYSPTPFAPGGSKRALLGAKSSSSTTGSTSRNLGPALSFGRELSLNAPRPHTFNQPSLKGKGRMLPPSVPEGKLASPSRLHTTSSQENMRSPGPPMMWRAGRRESEPAVQSPAAGTRDGSSSMDIDSPAPAGRASALNSPAPTHMGSPDLGGFWCESPAHPVQQAATKRRAPPSPGSPSSSPSAHRLRTDKSLGSMSSTALFSTWNRTATASHASGALQRRSAPYASKRPSLHPVASTDGQRAMGTNSANPILCGPSLAQRSGPMRRANSMFCDRDGSDEETDFEASPSIPDIRRRYGRPPLPRVDGSPNKNRSSVPHCVNPVARPLVRAESVSLPGGRETEAKGKILPCHTTKEDGLMRITAETLRDVLDGRYNDKMKRFHIIDCRFDYEFEGGHIDGAINIRQSSDIESLLLSPNGGINAVDGFLPAPSTSETGDCKDKVVLIFHCEFSKKRAPDVARILRKHDRKLNERAWPRIHYPELYILEGGYCNFFKQCPTKCEPQAYREMEGHDECEAKLNNFKKNFQRTRSLPAGEMRLPVRGDMPPPPSCGPLAFAAASSAASRRRGISEASNSSFGLDSSPLAADGSPCAPRSLFGTTMAQPLFGSVSSRTHNRAGFQRHASFAGASVRR